MTGANSRREKSRCISSRADPSVKPPSANSKLMSSPATPIENARFTAAFFCSKWRAILKKEGRWIVDANHHWALGHRLTPPGQRPLQQSA